MAKITLALVRLDQQAYLWRDLLLAEVQTIEESHFEIRPPSTPGERCEAIPYKGHELLKLLERLKHSGSGAGILNLRFSEVEIYGKQVLDLIDAGARCFIHGRDRDKVGDARLIERSDLYEASPVGLGAKPTDRQKAYGELLAGLGVASPPRQLAILVHDFMRVLSPLELALNCADPPSRSAMLEALHASLGEDPGSVTALRTELSRVTAALSDEIDSRLKAESISETNRARVRAWLEEARGLSSDFSTLLAGPEDIALEVEANRKAMRQSLSEIGAICL